MRSTALCFVAAFLFSIPVASAESWEDDGSYSKDAWPLQVTKRPLVLAPGMLELAGNTVRVNLSKDLVAKPISLAPSLFYGINKKLSVGILHDTGICVASEANGCAKTYNDVAAHARFSVMGRGNFHLAAIGGLALPSLSDPTVVGMNAGLSAKIMAGKFAIETSPIVYVGFTERDEMSGRFDDNFRAPLSIQMQLNNQTAVAVVTGIEGPLSNTGDFYTVPVGLNGIFAISEKLDVGATFRFANLAGKDGDADQREVIGHLALRL